jgi:inner membrane transporter RhtA
VAAGAVSVQFGAAIATNLFGKAGPAGAVTLRLVFAAVALMLIVRPRLSLLRRPNADRVDVAVVVAFGLVLAAMNLSFYESLARIPLGVAVTVEFAGPLAVTIGSSRRKADVIWAVLAGGGVFLLAGGGVLGAMHRLDLVGVWFALLAGACWALYILLNAQTGQRFAGTSGLAVAMAVGALAVLPYGISVAGRHLLRSDVLLLGLFVAFLSSVIPYTFELMALRRVTPRAFGILLSMEPAIAALAGLVVLGQRLAGAEIVALFLVIVANVGSSCFDRAGDSVPEGF